MDSLDEKTLDIMAAILRKHSELNYPVINDINDMSMDLYGKGCNIVEISLVGKDSFEKKIQHKNKVTIHVKKGKLS